jgi:hypothetical protein
MTNYYRLLSIEHHFTDWIEVKVERRKSNRVAQRRHREKRAKEWARLLQENQALTAENRTLRDTNEKLQKDIACLRTIQEPTRSNTPLNREMLWNQSESLGSEELKEENADLRGTIQEPTEIHTPVNKEMLWDDSQPLRRELPLDGKSSRVSATWRPSSWSLVYGLMRCKVRSCPLKSECCWEDPTDKKHYKLRALHLGRLVDYVDDGGNLESHDDVPNDIRRDLVLEADDAPATEVPYTTPISINVRPAQTTRASVVAEPPALSFELRPHLNPPDALFPSGDLRDYTSRGWLFDIRFDIRAHQSTQHNEQQ